MLIIIALIVTDAVSDVVDVPWWAYLILAGVYILGESTDVVASS